MRVPIFKIRSPRKLDGHRDQIGMESGTGPADDGSDSNAGYLKNPQPSGASQQCVSDIAGAYAAP